ncbi:MAG: ribulose bisphosphate carboxylase small subunit [Acinetobacter sp.]|nr:ribulose bisphosphate carboxylase small subunit [Acinetobacter sp.]
MKYHPNKEISQAIEYALNHGWHMVESGKSSHCYCRLRCNFAHSSHQMSVWSTPKSTENHAKQIIRKVNECKGEIE